MNGGEGEIRTRGGIATTPVFKTGALNRSATSPKVAKHTRLRRQREEFDKIAGSDFGQRSWPERSEGESQGRDEQSHSLRHSQ